MGIGHTQSSPPARATAPSSTPWRWLPLVAARLDVDELSSGEMSHLAGLCDNSERARAGRFVFDADRRAHLASHGLLRLLLSRCHPERSPSRWRFERSSLGRPTLSNPLAARGELRFSLTHCRSRVACVVAAGYDCGIDVEPIRPIPGGYEILAERVLTDEELRWVGRGGDAATELQRFLVLWTLKEAITKAAGVGLTVALDQLHLDPSGTEPTVVRAQPVLRGPWKLRSRVDLGHVEATAVDLSGRTRGPARAASESGESVIEEPPGHVSQ